MQRAFTIAATLVRPRAFALTAARSPLASALAGRQFSATALSKADENRIFVGGLPHEAEETDLQAAFEKYGSIRDAFVARDPAGRSKKFGFVSFGDGETLQSVLSESSHEILGQSVTVNESRPRLENRPSRGPREGTRDFSERRPQKEARPSKSIFLGNLPFDLTEADISESLARFDTSGGLQSVKIPIRRDAMEDDTRANKGFAFVEMNDIDAASVLIENVKEAVAAEGFAWPAPEGRTFTPIINYAQPQAPRRDSGFDSSRGNDRRPSYNDRRDQTRFDKRGKHGGRTFNRSVEDSY